MSEPRTASKFVLTHDETDEAPPRRKSAACRDWVDVFDKTFNTRRRHHELTLAVCARCAVHRTCLDNALTTVTPTTRLGMRGGLMLHQRVELSRQRG